MNAPTVGTEATYVFAGTHGGQGGTITSVSPSGHKVTLRVDWPRGTEDKVFTRRGHGKYCERGTDYIFLRLDDAS